MSKNLKVLSILGSQEVVKNLAFTSDSYSIGMLATSVTRMWPPPPRVQKMVFIAISFVDMTDKFVLHIQNPHDKVVFMTLVPTL